MMWIALAKRLFVAIIITVSVMFKAVKLGRRVRTSAAGCIRGSGQSRIVLWEVLALGYHRDMSQKPFLAVACAHLTDERLYDEQVAALEADYECTVFAFRDHDSLGGMAEELLAKTPARFTLIGLSLGGYLAFEIIRRELQRIEHLVLMDRPR